MSDTYTKLFRSITASTIVSEPLATRWLWVTMLSQSDSAGHVWGSIPGLARLANITLPQCQAALTCLLSPDPYSRTQANQGRRIEAIDGGWLLLNHAKYDAIRNEIERAEYKRDWDRKHRPSGHARQSDKQSDIPTESPTKPDSPTPPALTPTLVKQDQKQKQPSASPSALPDPPDWVDLDAWAGFVAMRVRERHPLTARAASLIFKSMDKHRANGCDPNAILDQSTRNGWRDVFPIRQEKTHASSITGGKDSLAQRVWRKSVDEELRDRSQRHGNADIVGAHGVDLPAQVVKRLR